MNEISLEFCFHGNFFECVLYSDIPFDDLVNTGHDLIEYIEEEAQK